MSKAPPKNEAAAEPAADYTVITPVESGGDVYPPGSTITLTAEQAKYPLRINAIKLKAD